ncbi:hypothetical protein GQ472_06110 [archaeon]|nr:hypothetical protein [archaeon]
MDYRFNQARKRHGLFRVIVTMLFGRFMLPVDIEIGMTVNVIDSEIGQSRRRKISSVTGDFSKTVIRY